MHVRSLNAVRTWAYYRDERGKQKGIYPLFVIGRSPVFRQSVPAFTGWHVSFCRAEGQCDCRGGQAMLVNNARLAAKISKVPCERVRH